MQPDIFENYPELHEPFEKWWNTAYGDLMESSIPHVGKLAFKEVAQKAYLASYENTMNEMCGWND